MTLYRHVAIVQTRIEFPIDMLRVDKCWPATIEDSQEIARSQQPDNRRARSIVVMQETPHFAARWSIRVWAERGAALIPDMVVRVEPDESTHVVGVFGTAGRVITRDQPFCHAPVPGMGQSLCTRPRGHDPLLPHHCLAADVDARQPRRAIAIAMERKPKCRGSQDEHGNPLCEGPDVQKVRVEGWAGHEPFETDWCSECRADVIAQGAEVWPAGVAEVPR
jgi:hypothetical protein